MALRDNLKLPMCAVKGAAPLWSWGQQHGEAGTAWLRDSKGCETPNSSLSGMKPNSGSASVC